MDFDRAEHCVDHAAELDDAAVAGALDDAAAMDRDRGVDQIASQRAPVNGNELFDEFLREALVFAMLRSRRNRLGNSGWFFHGDFLSFAKAAQLHTKRSL